MNKTSVEQLEVRAGEDAASHLRSLVRRLAEQEGLRRIEAALKERRAAAIDGVWGSACALTAAAVAQKTPSHLFVVVCPKAEQIDQWLDDLAVFSRLRAEPFPPVEALEGDRVGHDDLFGSRLRLLKSLRRGERPAIVVTSIQALLQPVPDPALLDAKTKTLTVGDSIPMEELTRWLAAGGFHATTAVELPMEFSARGGVLDIFAPDWTEPVRVEFFGDQIDSLRRFDLATQRGTGPVDRIDLTLLTGGEPDAAHLADHVPSSSRFVLVEPRELETQGRQYLERLERPQDVHSVTSVLRRALEWPTITMTELAEAVGDETWTPQVGSVERFTGKAEQVRAELDTVEPGHDVFLVCQTAAEAQRLGKLFAETRLAAQGRLYLPVGRLRGGFRLPEHAAVVLSTGEVFGRADLRRTARRRLGRAIDSFVELRPGDLVVHLAHGIGRYRGIRLIEKADRSEEHLEIEFAEGAKVYVPSSKIALVQKYVAGSKSRPRLAKIGGQLWAKRKQLVEQAVVDMAADMIELQASREKWPGIPYPRDTAWQSEFDAAFPYQETDDQLVTIEAVKQDMMLSRPMDRLICGDVGFGKTEIAMRAAFKAVDAGYQVAMLVPTTVLAEQHYRTFSDRMAEFPFEIAVLSRFATKKHQSEIIRRLADGATDIAIGTHRLAQRDVAFQNLGLVIIDEEQRFGVEIKERLKAIRQTVDVLTMTATPIPRTLHMALLGIRHISNLVTAPEDRVAVETRVTRFNPELIRHAFLRELNRGGQVFFVHNRVRDIERIKTQLLRIVPEARIEIGHAQMPENELERVMLGFVRNEFDVLLSTTIIESGLDIPNANTIFINDADRFGLSDLHQLRGRVGRYKHQAYCYLLVNRGKSLTPVAARRLHAIEEFCDLGAGFALAMRDLEIRGTGNILGTQQSGHIALVGYELYCQLLEGAVRRLRNLPPKETVEVDIELPGEAYLPDDYIPDMRAKIDLYRRLARATSAEELADLREELEDRFGQPPQPVESLLALASLRVAAHGHRVSRIYTEEEYLVFACRDAEALERLIRRNRGRLRKVDGLTACLPVRKKDRIAAALCEIVKSMLRSDA